MFLATLLVMLPAGGDGSPIEPIELGPPVLSSFFWGDVDGDGLPDALVLQPGAAPKLLRGHPEGGFEDVTASAGLGGLPSARQALWHDVDGDRDQDLLLTSPQGGSALFLNRGGTFAKAGVETGLALDEGVLYAEFVDFDADGLDDLHLATLSEDQLYKNLGQARFEPMELALPPRATAPRGREAGGSISASATPATTSAGGALQGSASFVCLDAVTDQITGACLMASSVPTLGMLYPLGQDLNIDGAGRVGIGTLAPAYQLDVAGDVHASGRLVSSVATGAPLVVASSDLVANLNADRIDGYEASDFSQLGATIEMAELADDSVNGAKVVDDSLTALDLAPDSVGSSEISTQAVGSGELADGSVASVDLAPDAVTTNKILDGTITSADIGTGAVTTDEILDGTITSADLGVLALTGTDITDGSIGAADLADDSVNSAKVVDDSLTSFDLAPDSVGSSEIADGAVANIDLAPDAVSGVNILNGSIGTVDLADGTVNGAKVADGSIATADLADDSVNSAKVAEDSLTALDLAPDSVGSSEIASGAVTTDEIATGAVTTIEIQNGTITGSDIAFNTITKNQIATDGVGSFEIEDNAVTSAKILDGTITSADLGPLSLTGADIVDGSIDSTELAEAAVTSFAIMDGTITGFDIAFNTITQAQIAADAVSASELATAAVTSTEIKDGTIVNLDVSSGADIDGTKIDSDFGAQDVTTTGNLGVGTTTPDTDVHVVGSSTLAAVLIAPNEPLSGDNSALTLAEDENGSHGVKLVYDGLFNVLRVMGRLNDVDTTTHIAIERDTGETSIGNNGVQEGMLTVNGTADFFYPAVKAYGGFGGALDGRSDQASGAAIYGKHTGSLGYGVWGYGGSGSTGGVYGETYSSGVGVYGYASSAASAAADGLWGISYSAGGNGVYAYTDQVYGVYTTSAGASGRGVYGRATLGTGTNYGVQGYTASSSGYGVYSSGDMGTSGAKAFLQPHPSDPSQEIRFYSLEGNESGTYFRGTAELVGGTAVIEVPEEFRLASEAEGITVQLTPRGPGADLWYEEPGLESIAVHGSYDVAFDYTVNGVRRGWTDVEVFRPNTSFVPDERGVPFGTQYPPAYRQLLVDNGILNDDFTPNEDVAAQLGWELHEPGHWRHHDRADGVAETMAARQADMEARLAEETVPPAGE